MSKVFENTGEGGSQAVSKKVAVCISASSDLAFAAAVTFLNFIEIHGVQGFHFRLFSDSRLPRMAKIFKNLGADFEVEVYKPPVSWTKLWGSKEIAYCSPLVLAKFEGFRLLSSFPTVVWLDYDIVIRASLSELWTRGEFDIAYLNSSQSMKNGFLVAPEGIDDDKEGMSAALIVFKRSFRDWGSASQDLYKIMCRNYSNLYYPEQAVFDLYLDRHPSFTHWRLDSRFCAFPGKESAQDLILHSYGSKKFWSGIRNDSWNRYYSDWQDLGGWRWRPSLTWLRKLWRGLKHISALLLLILLFRGPPES